MITFITVFFSINFLANWYIFSRLYSFFHMKTGPVFWLLIIGLSVSYVALVSLDKTAGFFLSRWMLRVAGFWMGAGLLLLMCLLAGDLVLLATRISQDVLRWFVLGAAAVLILYSLLNAYFVQIIEIRLPASVNKTIVHLSDIHVGSVARTHLNRLVRITNRQKPDLVLITGDLMDSYSGLSDRSFESLKDIKVPIYFTIGNHERYTGLKTVEDLISRTPMIALRNESADLGDIQIIGIDDGDRHAHADEKISQFKTDPNKYSILMYHRPSGFEKAAEKGIDLMLSGHTHNGQIWPFNYLVKTHFPRMKGLHRIGDSTLFISTGAGTWGPPMRLGSRSQVVVIKLQNRN